MGPQGAGLSPGATRGCDERRARRVARLVSEANGLSRQLRPGARSGWRDGASGESPGQRGTASPFPHPCRAPSVNYSLRSASTGSFLLAALEGNNPDTNVSTTLMHTSTMAAVAGSRMMLGTS